MFQECYLILCSLWAFEVMAFFYWGAWGSEWLYYLLEVNNRSTVQVNLCLCPELNFWITLWHWNFLKKSFYHKWILNFVKGLLCIYWDNRMTFIFQFVNVVNYIDWFVDIEESLHPWDKAHLVMVYDPSHTLELLPPGCPELCICWVMLILTASLSKA